MQEEKRQVEVIKKASDNTTEGIVNGITSLKLNVAKYLDKLSEQLTAEFKKLEDIQADKLSFDEKIKNEGESFETSLKAQKELWKTEQQKWADQQKEIKEKSDKDRKREEEEYVYNLKLTRKKESDLYEEKKASLEKTLTEKKTTFDKEIAQREAEVVSAEIELKELRTKNAASPAETSVKDIAMKAIESSGKMQLISNSRDNSGKE